MHEIVIVRTGYYEQGEEVNGEWLLKHRQGRHQLWWFDGPFTDKDLGLVLKPHPEHESSMVMSCTAIRFGFEFVPNLRYLEHFQPGSSYLKEDFEIKGCDLFEHDIPTFIEIVRRKIKESEFAPLFSDTDFYALYDVELDEYRDEDGGLDDIEVMPTLLGELDISKIASALVTTEGSK